MNFEEIIHTLESLANTKDRALIAGYGITPDRAYCVSLPHLREIARQTKRNHPLALRLWAHGFRETQILAAMLAEPACVTAALIEEWALTFSYWEICDQCVMNLFEKSPLAWSIALEYSVRPEEFVKRTGFVIMARLAVSDKKATNEKFEPFFPSLLKESVDERNMVKKAVNWAIRQIGKRNLVLNERALALCMEIQRLESKAARWIAADALRELRSEAVQQKLRKK